MTDLGLTVHTWTYVAVGYYVYLAICELGCELGGNRGLIPIVIVIVIECHFIFSKAAP